MAKCCNGAALTAAGMMEAAKGFRRLKAYKQLPILRAALIAHAAKPRAIKDIEPQATPHSMPYGNACFAYLNKNWGYVMQS